METKANQPHCVFCQVISGTLPASRVMEDDHCVVFMDIFPLRPGHTLVVPKVHHQYLNELEPELRNHVIDVGTRIADAIRRSDLPCDGFNFAVNEGRAAQQTVPHCHLHVLPRKRGDLFGLVGQVLKKPIQVVLKPNNRQQLDRQAASIANHLK